MTMFWFDRPIGVNKESGWQKVGFSLWSTPLRRDGKVLAVVSENIHMDLDGLDSMTVREMRNLIEKEKENGPVRIRRGFRIKRG